MNPARRTCARTAVSVMRDGTPSSRQNALSSHLCATTRVTLVITLVWFKVATYLYVYIIFRDIVGSASVR